MTALIGANLTTTVADLNEGRGFTLGNVLTDHRGYRYTYAKASSAISQYSYVCIDELGAALNGTKTLVDAGYQVAIAPIAFAADDYGFFQISGVTSLLTAGSVAADTSIYTSATAGSVDDASTSQTQLAGVVLTAATSTAATSGACFIGASGIFTPATI